MQKLLEKKNKKIKEKEKPPLSTGPTGQLAIVPPPWASAHLNQPAQLPASLSPPSCSPGAHRYRGASPPDHLAGNAAGG